MKKFFDGIKSLLSDERGSISSKRLIGLLCAVMLCLTMYQNSFSEEHVAPSKILVESVALLAFGCLGLASVDKFTFGKKSDNKEKTDNDQ